MADEKQKHFFTKKELMTYDGIDGKPAYIAFKGKIYDVSKSYLWANGNHLSRHIAGADLTERIQSAPHGDEVLLRYKIVGELVENEHLKQTLTRKLINLHIHPISVHFPIVFALFAPAFAFLYFFTSWVSCEAISYYLLLLGFLSSPVTILSGLFSWRITYEGSGAAIFRRKMVFSAILMIIVTACFALRLFYPNILNAKDSYSYGYLSLMGSLIPTVTVLGYDGGKIIYS